MRISSGSSGFQTSTPKSIPVTRMTRWCCTESGQLSLSASICPADTKSSIWRIDVSDNCPLGNVFHGEAGWSRFPGCGVWAQLEGVLPKSIWRRWSAAVSAAARSTTSKPVEFRARVWQSGLLRVADPRSVPFGQHAPDTTTIIGGKRFLTEQPKPEQRKGCCKVFSPGSGFRKSRKRKTATMIPPAPAATFDLVRSGGTRWLKQNKAPLRMPCGCVKQ